MPTLIFSDDFVGTNGQNLTARTPVVGTSYNTAGTSIGATVQSNRAQLTSSSTGFVLANPVSTTPDDQSAEATLRLNGSTASITGGVVVRYTDTSNFYLLRASASNIILLKLVAGSSTTLYTLTQSLAIDTDITLKLEVIGTTLKAYINGVLDSNFTTVDTSLASGRTGMRVTSDNAATKRVLVEDFWAYNEGSVSASNAPRSMFYSLNGMR